MMLSVNWVEKYRADLMETSTLLYPPRGGRILGTNKPSCGDLTGTMSRLLELNELWISKVKVAILPLPPLAYRRRSQ